MSHLSSHLSSDATAEPASPTSAGRWSTTISLIRLEGADARRVLHGQSSQAIEQAPAGSCLATCLIGPTARLRGLALVRLDDGGADLLVLAGDGQAVHQALDRVLFPADRVRLGAPEPAELVRWLGPIASAVTPDLLQPGVDLGAGAEQPAWLRRGDAPLPPWLAELPELTPAQVELQRLHQGFPAAPNELNDDTNPFELGLAAWVSLNKGCYVGQETLAKLATYDGVKQQLRHWRAQHTAPAAVEACSPGSPLITPEGGRAGVITSQLVTSTGMEGLALVRRAALAEPELLAGESGASALRLTLRTPAGFVAPPVGAGGSGRR